MNRLLERLLPTLLLGLSVVLPPTAHATPVLVSTTALKIHGAAGSFYLALGNTPATITVEPRLGPTQTLVFNFDGPVTSGSAAVLEGAATVGTSTYSGNQMIVPLSSVNNEQYVTVAVRNVSTSTTGSGGSGVIRVGYLGGDVNQNRVVTVSDVTIVNGQITHAVTGANYLDDVNANGVITVSDKLLVNNLVTTALPPYGFWDQGFNDPKVRTNYPTSTKGTSADPLAIIAPCLFSGCASYPTTYTQSNAYSENMSSFSDAPFWTLINNNEPSYNNSCNSGPPDNSGPQSLPGSGLFGFATIMDTPAGENFYRAHLVLNMTFANPCSSLGPAYPYMSFGAHTNRGNEGFPGAINATSSVPHSVSFTTKLFSYASANALLYRLVAVSGWPDSSGRFVPRMVQLDLLHDGVNDSCLLDGSNCAPGQTPGPGHLPWSWPMQDDTFYPGADIAYFDAEDVASLCGFSVRRMTSSDVGTDINYDVDIDALFQCASRLGTFSNAIPSTANLPITSVDWAVEGYTASSSGWIWTAVHNTVMH